MTKKRTTSPGADGRGVALLAVDEHDVPEAPHDREVGGVLAPGEQLVAVDQEVVHHDELLAGGGAEVVGARRVDEHVAVESAVLLDVFAHVRVVPVEARVGKDDLVDELAAGGDGWLGDVGDAVEAVLEAEAVPVDRGRQVDRVREADDDARVLGDAQEGAGVLAVEAVHDEGAAADPALYDAGLERDRVPVGDVEGLAGGGPCEGCGVDALARQEGVDGWADAAEAGQHGIAQHHHDHVAGAADRVSHGHVHVHRHVHGAGTGGVLGRGGSGKRPQRGEHDGLEKGGRDDAAAIPAAPARGSGRVASPAPPCMYGRHYSM